MLIDFTFGNFRSFRDEATLSMVAADTLDGNEELDAKNVIKEVRSDLNVLRVAAIYGANASGKSNVVRAYTEFVRAVGLSANTDYRFNGLPYLLDETSQYKPLTLEVTFLLNRKQYRYGFEATVNVADTPSSHRFDAEWLFETENNQEKMLFSREGETVEFRDYPEIDVALDEGGFYLQPSSLILSVVSRIPKNRFTKSIVKDIRDKFRYISGRSDVELRRFTESALVNGRFHSEVSRLLMEAGTGVDDLYLEQKDGETAGLADALTNEDVQSRAQQEGEQTNRPQIFTVHNLYDEEGRLTNKKAALPMDGTASEGTRKLFAYSGPIWDTLENGYTLFIDEMDARFHPLITQTLIQLFQSKETNPNDAQLVFVTHDTNLLSSRLLRRDQIYFVEKERTGASRLYSLAEFDLPSISVDFENDYLQGKYGAIPFLGGLRRLLHSQVPRNGASGTLEKGFLDETAVVTGDNGQ